MTKLIAVPAALAIFIGVVSAHVDDPQLPEGCGSCHVGHGMPGEPMLSATEEEFCYQCHGSQAKRSAMKAAGRLAADAEPVDMESVFRKTYRHPVVEGSGHSPTERLPDVMGASVGHAECVDCHNPHQRHGTQAVKGYQVPGYSLAGQYLQEAQAEYEVCLKCHATSVSGSRPQANILAQFAGSPRSQHAVVGTRSGNTSPSLVPSLSAGVTLKCSDCHTNDDPRGPRGPHGSRYQFLLSGNYQRDVFTDESPFAFEFCYSCHDRRSILGNESFPLHREHIVGNPLKGIRGTSCYTCHASHSSERYPFLIAFNPEAVQGSSQQNMIEYRSWGDRSGQCYLTCHGYSHEPSEYEPR